jgi:hypothetical protein
LTHCILVFSSLLAVFALSLNAQERMKPGNWEVVYTGEIPHTTTTCITPEMTKGINGTAAEVRAETDKVAAKRNMKIENYKFDGTNMSYTVVGADRTFVNTASYHGDTYESHIIVKAANKETTTHQKGRRVGACP